MRILRTVKELRAWRQLQPSVGLVPTMGALHNGHLDLVARSMRENHATVMSIFVNPSQFSPTEDLDQYPRTFESDVALFEAGARKLYGEAGAARSAAVFAPLTSEMYPRGIELDRTKQVGTFVEVLGCSHQLEGAVRPHFFRGVATIVTKLLNAAQPTRAYFGQKDVQQTVVVRNLVADLLIPTEIVICDTAREASGLALSSRNAYLSAEEKERATVLYRALQTARDSGTSAATIKATVRDLLEKSEIVAQVEYVSVNDLNTFEELSEAVPGKSVVSAAIRLKSGLRLLDNVTL